jgi:hypothetical protein
VPNLKAGIRPGPAPNFENRPRAKGRQGTQTTVPKLLEECGTASIPHKCRELGSPRDLSANHECGTLKYFVDLGEKRFFEFGN